MKLWASTCHMHPVFVTAKLSPDSIVHVTTHFMSTPSPPTQPSSIIHAQAVHTTARLNILVHAQLLAYLVRPSVKQVFICFWTRYCCGATNASMPASYDQHNGAASIVLVYGV